jgi:hypothetical protein
MSKFVVGCKVVIEHFDDDTAEIVVLKEKLKTLGGVFRWVVSDHEGLLDVIREKDMFKISNGKIKIGDYAFNPISSSVTLIDEDDDLIYVNETFHKVQNYKKPKENIHESNNS